jgi:hypothetical protein
VSVSWAGIVVHALVVCGVCNMIYDLSHVRQAESVLLLKVLPRGVNYGVGE